MGCGCNNSNPCVQSDTALTTCDPANEGIGSQINNFTSAFFGELTKTCVDGQVVWDLPCNLDEGVTPQFPRVEGEGLACYFMRIFSELGIFPEGLWNPLTTYYTNAAVSYNGELYISTIDDNLNNVPNALVGWEKYVSQGPEGPQGPTGPPGGVESWSEVTTDGTITEDSFEWTNKAGTRAVRTLPGTFTAGKKYRIAGKGSTGWRIAQATGQTIYFGNVNTTTGTSGYLESTNQYDAVELLCITANTDFVVISSQGNITYN